MYEYDRRVIDRTGAGEKQFTILPGNIAMRNRGIAAHVRGKIRLFLLKNRGHKEACSEQQAIIVHSLVITCGLLINTCRGTQIIERSS